MGLRAQTTGEISGLVQTIGADGQPLALVGAEVTVVSKTEAALRFSTQSDDAGTYKFTAIPPGAYTLTARLEGYQESSQDVPVEPGGKLELTLTLTIKKVSVEVTVRGETEGIQVAQTSPETQIASGTLVNAPLVQERFIEALPLVPGVVRGPDGLIKIKGASSTQTGWLVNSANVTDPVTGEQAISLPVDVIEDLQVLPNPFSAEYGKFSGAVTKIETKPATDKYIFSINNFIPRLRRRAGGFRGIESATPRITFSGPIVKGKLAFTQSLEYRLNRLPIESLPELERDTDQESFDSFTQFDLTLRAGHQVTGVFSAYPQRQRFATLNTFNPQPATANYKQKGWMTGLRDRYLFGDNSLLESTFSLKDFDVNIFPATAGTVFTLRPDGNSDSFFNTQNRISRRYEWLEVYSFAPHQAGGQHQLKAGFTFSRDLFRGRYESHTVEVRRGSLSDTLAEQIEFIGDPEVERNKSEVGLFLHDKWNPTRRLTFDLGARYDYDSLAKEHNVSPRLAFAYVLTSDNRTLLRGGAGLFYDK
ncbi:MAG: TonB-dependent receptor, partial [Candidatus Acidiferrales bacterium]